MIFPWNSISQMLTTEFAVSGKETTRVWFEYPRKNLSSLGSRRDLPPCGHPGNVWVGHWDAWNPKQSPRESRPRRPSLAEKPQR
jgi:hypothetical protein